MEILLGLVLGLGLVLWLFLFEKKRLKKVPQWQLDSRKAMMKSLDKLKEKE